MIKGSHQTEESKRKNSESHKNRTPWNKGRKGIYSEDTLNKMSKAKIGHTPWNKDTHIQLNTGKTHFKKGQIPYNKGKLRPEFLGENNPNWNGGNQLRISRRNNKRRDLGNINLNSPLECTVGHHINMDYIIYIPIWINKIPHNIRTGKNMGYVNALTFFWLCYTEEINNCKEI